MDTVRNQIEALLTQGATTLQVADAMKEKIEYVESIQAEIVVRSGPVGEDGEAVKTQEDREWDRLQKRARDMVANCLDVAETIINDEDSRPLDVAAQVKIVLSVASGECRPKEIEKDKSTDVATIRINKLLKKSTTALDNNMKQLTSTR